jgi:hypothetical protein
MVSPFIYIIMDIDQISHWGLHQARLIELNFGSYSRLTLLEARIKLLLESGPSHYKIVMALYGIKHRYRLILNCSC